MSRFHSKKDTVNDYKALGVKTLKRLGYLSAGWHSGSLTWKRNGERVGGIGISVSILGSSGTMRLNYTYNDAEQMNYEITLTATACHYGGFRWWFICCCNKNGVYCGRRVGVLYFAGKYAACRHCYDLTYESCQESHKFDRLALQIGLPSEKYLRALFKRERE